MAGTWQALHLAWQAWHLWHWAGSGGALGPVLVAGDAAAFCVAGVANGDIRLRFTWQAWHLATTTFVLRGRRGTYGTDAFALLCHTCESWFKVFCQVLSRDFAATLSTLAGEPSRSDSEDTLEEQAAVLLQLPRKLDDVCAQLCEKLQKVPLPALGQVAAPLGSLCPVLCTRPPTHAIDDHVHCTVIALSGNVVAELFVLRGQPWLDAIPFGCWCHNWGVASFHLSEKDIVAFPQPRLSQLVPAHGPEIVLKLITSNNPPPVNIRVVIGKAAATSAAYRPQPSTSPLYDFCELQTLMLRNLDQVQLRDVDLRCPDSPLAKHLRQRFYEMLGRNVKLGKRTLSEFRADASTSTYNIHVLVSSDGQRLAYVRSCFLTQFIFVCLWWKTAKSLHGISRLSRKSAMRFSMLEYNFLAQAALAVLGARIVDPTWRDMPGCTQFRTGLVQRAKNQCK